MKKISIIIIILLSIIFIKVFALNNINKINLQLDEGEYGITFIIEDKITAVLISKNKNSDIIVLNYNNGNIDNIAKKFDTTINNIYNTNFVDIEYNNIISKPINNKNGVIKLIYNNMNFCISIKDKHPPNIADCNFLYMYDFSNINHLNPNIDMVFQNYNNVLPIHIQEDIYENWIDLYTINKEEYITLKISKDYFNTIIIPISS